MKEQPSLSSAPRFLGLENRQQWCLSLGELCSLDQALLKSSYPLERHVCYTCCVLHASWKSDPLEDFSTTEPPKCLLMGRVGRKGRGEAASALGQPAARASPLSHPFPRPGSKVGLAAFHCCFWFCGVSNAMQAGWGWGLLHSSLKAQGGRAGARLGAQGWQCLPTSQSFGAEFTLGSPWGEPSDLLSLTWLPSGIP